jgi:hypothetical protein
LQLSAADIDSERMVLHVRDTKNGSPQARVGGLLLSRPAFEA